MLLSLQEIGSGSIKLVSEPFLSWAMTQTRLDARVDSVEAHLSSLHDTVQSQAQSVASLTEKIEMVIKGQSLIATELADGKFGVRGGGSGVQSAGGSRMRGGSPSRGDDSGFRGDFRPCKMDLPIFSGGDPDEWTYRAERYFGLQRLSAAEQLEAAVMCLEEAALHWFRWENMRRPITSWEELKELLVRRFRPVTEGSLYDRLLTLRQTATMQEYRRSFEAIASALGNLDEEMLVSSFQKGA